MKLQCAFILTLMAGAAGECRAGDNLFTYELPRTDAFANLRDLAITRIAVQDSGAILAAGTISCPGRTIGTSRNTDVVVLRYNPDGSPDAAFGSRGLIRRGFQKKTFVGNLETNDSVAEIVPASDGKILIVGQSDSEIFLARYNEDGSPDGSFGASGVVRPGAICQAITSVTYLANGCLAIAASLDSTMTRPDPNGYVGRTSIGAGFIGILDRAGNFRKAFNQTGAIYFRDLVPSKVLEIDRGRLVVAGSDGKGLCLIRLLPDGRFDSEFNTQEGLRFDSLAPGAASKLFSLNGFCSTADGRLLALIHTSDGVTALIRFLANGNQDSSYFDGGLRVFNESTVSTAQLSVEPVGRVVISGSHSLGSGFLSRVNPDGGYDPTFGEGGTIILKDVKHSVLFQRPLGHDTFIVAGTGGPAELCPMTRIKVSQTGSGHSGSRRDSVGTGGVSRKN